MRRIVVWPPNGATEPATPIGRRMIKRRLSILVVLAAALPLGTCAPSAQATWGPNAECKIANAWHCYALSWRKANDLGSILFADTESADVYDYYNGGLATEEQWISFAHQHGFVEMGQVEGWGPEYGCCTVHPFFAEETPSGEYHKRVAEGSGLNVYAHYLIYDTEQNAIWRMYWGEWTEEEHYGGWSETRFAEQEAGTEVGSEVRPIDNGRDEVARWYSGSSPWYPWSGAEYAVFPEGALCMHHNAQLPAEGNTEWRVGSC
jgi:hypothetical protein